MTVPAKETTLRIEKIKDHVGAEVSGVDLRKPDIVCEQRESAGGPMIHPLVRGGRPV